jgi:uncharacterized protein DUF2490
LKFGGIKIIASIIYLLFINGLQAQDTGIKPQYWNNINIGWEVNNHLVLTNTLSYNVLIDKDLPWSEFSYNATAIYRINSFILGNGGFYIAATKQSEYLNSLELRPYIGIRVSTKIQKRWILSNLLRLEWRNLNYSDDTKDGGIRLRNRTTAAIALNQKTILDDHTLSLFSYFEAFHNFEKDIEERYFTIFMYKFGLAYRFSPQWQINLGTLFEQARNTIVGPSQIPTDVATNFIFEWGLSYSIINDN